MLTEAFWFDSLVMLLYMFLSSQLGNTALHIAAGAGYQAVVKLLMEYGASPLIENKVWHQQEFLLLVFFLFLQ